METLLIFQGRSSTTIQVFKFFPKLDCGPFFWGCVEMKEGKKKKTGGALLLWGGGERQKTKVLLWVPRRPKPDRQISTFRSFQGGVQKIPTNKGLLFKSGTSFCYIKIKFESGGVVWIEKARMMTIHRRNTRSDSWRFSFYYYYYYYYFFN